MKKVLAMLTLGALTTALASNALASEPTLNQLLEAMQKDEEQAQSSVIEATPPLALTTSDFTVENGAVITPEEDEVLTEAEILALDGDGDLEKAYLKLIQRYLVDANNPDALIRLAAAYGQSGNYGQAVQTLKKAIKLDCKNKKVQHLLAEKLSKSGYRGFKVYVQGDEVAFDVQPQIIKDRALLPVRKVCEALGATVDYKDGVITIALNGKKVILTVDSDKALVNGTPKQLDAPAVIVDGRTLVPLRFIGESLDKTVDYAAIDDSKVVSISNN